VHLVFSEIAQLVIGEVPIAQITAFCLAQTKLSSAEQNKATLLHELGR